MSQQVLFEEVTLAYKVEQAIGRIREFVPPEGYYVAFSGGKDSTVVLDLVRRAGVKYEAWFSVTTIDPPEVLHFIKQHYPEVQWDRPKQSFFSGVEATGLPMRNRRWCCKLLKERSGAGRIVVTGVRWEESKRRAGRKIVESCLGGGTRRNGKRFVNPIVDWSTEDIWQYIRERGLPYCSLYDEGMKRVGCVLCPMTGRDMWKSAERWPKYYKAYCRAAEKYLQKLDAEGHSIREKFPTGEAMMEWWITGTSYPAADEQTYLDFEN